jgi:hypothetical protein
MGTFNIAVTLSYRGKIIEKQQISDKFYKYVVEEISESSKPQVWNFIDERNDFKVGDYVYVYVLTNFVDYNFYYFTNKQF